MNIFVVGASRSGKTTFTKEFCSHCPEFQHVQASEWIKQKTGFFDPKMKGYRTKISTASIEELKQNPDACVDFIRNKYDLSMPTIIEGVRNPNDFIKLFNPSEDIFVRLYVPGKPHCGFDTGVRAIEETARFYLNTKFMPKRSRYYYQPLSRRDVYQSALVAGKTFAFHYKSKHFDL